MKKKLMIHEMGILISIGGLFHRLWKDLWLRLKLPLFPRLHISKSTAISYPNARFVLYVLSCEWLIKDSL